MVIDTGRQPRGGRRCNHSNQKTLKRNWLRLPGTRGGCELIVAEAERISSSRTEAMPKILEFAMAIMFCFWSPLATKAWLSIGSNPKTWLGICSNPSSCIAIGLFHASHEAGHVKTARFQLKTEGALASSSQRFVHTRIDLYTYVSDEFFPSQEFPC
ncbi:hypothetical protein AKJ16_DCAP03993 [Drosera capensis]